MILEKELIQSGFFLKVNFGSCLGNIFGLDVAHKSGRNEEIVDIFCREYLWTFVMMEETI